MVYDAPMKQEERSILADDSKSIHVYHWIPDPAPKGCVLIAHGLGEHAARYARFAQALAGAGYESWAPDHRGHGKTAAEGEAGWLADRDGFRRVIEDLRIIVQVIRKERPGVPVFLFGHSWGSFLSQGYCSLYGSDLAGCILSGTAGDGGPIIMAGQIIAAIGCALKGQKTPSPLLTTMSFGSYNKAFRPNRTEFDWLSRDTDEVDAYIHDPLCGGTSSFGLYRDLLAGLRWIHSPATMAAIPVTLPMYLFAGSRDPVGAATGSFDWLVRRYRELGIHDLESVLYPEGRHEVLNDTCRDEATAAVITWLRAHT